MQDQRVRKPAKPCYEYASTFPRHECDGGEAEAIGWSNDVPAGRQRKCRYDSVSCVPHRDAEPYGITCRYRGGLRLEDDACCSWRRDYLHGNGRQFALGDVSPQRVASSGAAFQPGSRGPGPESPLSSWEGADLGQPGVVEHPTRLDARLAGIIAAGLTMPRGDTASIPKKDNIEGVAHCEQNFFRVLGPDGPRICLPRRKRRGVQRRLPGRATESKTCENDAGVTHQRIQAVVAA